MTPHFRHTLPLEYSASIDQAAGVWRGEARIPGDYFPPDVTLFNAYAIHGTGADRAYEALYESSGPQADFHRSNLKYILKALHISSSCTQMMMKILIFQTGEVSTN